MQADERQFLEEMIDNAELLDCEPCATLTLHTHEEVLTRVGNVTTLTMRCTQCMNCRTWVESEADSGD